MSAQTLAVGVVIVLLAFACQTTNAEYDVAKYCQLVPVGTHFPSFQSCQTYFTCSGNGQVTTSTCSGTDVFDKDRQTCVSASSYSCYYDVAEPCEKKSGVWVSNPKDCRMWYYCSNGAILGSGTCPNGQYFDGYAGMCVNGQCANSGGTTQITNLCQIMENGKFFGDFDNCATWHKCSDTTMDSGTCGKGLIYNSEERMCLDSNGNMCAGPNETCDDDANNKEIANPSVCSIYFKCIQANSKWRWQQIQCPTGQYYDVISKACNYRQAATPIAGCNRCEFSTSTWVNAVDPNCNEFLTCNKGQEIGKGKCPAADGYFNEQGQMCINDDMGLQAYRAINGACKTKSAPGPNTTEQPAVTEPATENPAETETTIKEGAVTTEAATEKSPETETTIKEGAVTTEAATEKSPETETTIKEGAVTTEATTEKSPETETTIKEGDETK